MTEDCQCEGQELCEKHCEYRGCQRRRAWQSFQKFYYPGAAAGMDRLQ